MITEKTYFEMAKKLRRIAPNNLIALKELFLQLIWLSLGLYFSIHEYFILWFIGQIILGIGFWRSFAILHTCGHHAFFKKPILNDLTGLFFSLFCFLPYYSWKYIHTAHHIWTGWIDLDPTTMDLDKNITSWQKNVINFCWKYWIPILTLIYILKNFFNPKRGSLMFKDVKKTRNVILSILCFLIPHSILLIFFTKIYFTLFGLSTFIYFTMGDISLLTQHVHLPLDHSKGRKVKPKPLYQQDEYSHTMLLPNWVTNWIALGFNHHSLHHLFPKLPYYQMKDIFFEGMHTQDWKVWLPKAKNMPATDLLFENS